jgi:hypothetical protein
MSDWKNSKLLIGFIGCITAAAVAFDKPEPSFLRDEGVAST